MFDNTTASSLELLRFKPELGEGPGFAAALRQRVKDLADFAHPSIARVRKVEWLRDGEGLALVSNHTPGRRLSEVIHKAVGPSFALELVRQIIPVLASLEQQGPEMAHGTLTPERIVVMPDGRLVLTEHVIGPALECLRLPATQLRSQFGIVAPLAEDPVPLNGRSDVVQLGFMALSMLLGRRIDVAEYPEGGVKLLDELVQSSGYNSSAALRLRLWLERALQFSEQTFGSAGEAHAALHELPEESQLLMAAPPRNVRAFQAPVESAKTHAPQFPAEESIREPARAETVESSGSVALTSPQGIEEWRSAKSASHGETAALNRRRRWLVPVLGALAMVEAVVIVALALRAQGLLPTTDVGTAAPPAGTIATASTGPSNTVLSPKTPSAPAADPGSTPNGSGALRPAAPKQGRLEVSSDTAGARVTVDGTPRGQTPLALDLDPGPHAVVISDGQGTVSRTVTVTAGSSSTVMAAMGAAGVAAGWLSVTSPLELQILENGTLIGTTSAARVMLPAGRHDLVLSSSAVGFQTSISTDIRPGRTATATVTVPNGSLSLNALPWANVWVDGRAVGTTPVANLEVPLGSHDVIWRHPQLGERRQTTVVTAKAPVRLVMDLNK